MKKCPNCGADNEDIRGICKACGYDMRPKNPDGTVKYTFHTEESRFGFAVSSLVCGIIGLLLSCLIIGSIPAIVALVLGIIAVTKSDIKKEKIMAIVGLSCSGIALIVSFVVIFSMIASNSSDNSKNSYQAEESSESKNIIEKFQEYGKDDYISQCTTDFDYKDLIRNEKENVGKKIELEVKVQQIMQEGGITYYRAYTNDEYGFWLGNEFIIFDKRKDDKTKILADDILKVYGEYSGTETIVRALTGTGEDVPAVNMYYADFLDEGSPASEIDEETLNDGKIDTDFGDFFLKYDSYEMSEDYDGKDCVIVYFDYTNLSQENSSFGSSVIVKAFQNGVQCETAYIFDEDNKPYNDSYTEVKNGVTIKVAYAFYITDMSDIELECEKMLGNSVDTTTIQLQ